MSQARVVVVLKAVENHWRGTMAEERLNAGDLTIEHVMPQAWAKHWPLHQEPTPDRVSERDAAVQTLGNLTLVKRRLNSAMSHSAWFKKQKALNEHGVLLLNSRLIDKNSDCWDEPRIAARSTILLSAFKEIWPGPDAATWATPTIEAEPHAPD